MKMTVFVSARLDWIGKAELNLLDTFSAQFSELTTKKIHFIIKLSSSHLIFGANQLHRTLLLLDSIQLKFSFPLNGWKNTRDLLLLMGIYFDGNSSEYINIQTVYKLAIMLGLADTVKVTRFTGGENKTGRESTWASGIPRMVLL